MRNERSYTINRFLRAGRGARSQIYRGNKLGNWQLPLSLSLSPSRGGERGGKKMGFSARKKEVICMLEADTEARDMTWRSENGADR